MGTVISLTPADGNVDAYIHTKQKVSSKKLVRSPDQYNSAQLWNSFFLEAIQV